VIQQKGRSVLPDCRRGRQGAGRASFRNRLPRPQGRRPLRGCDAGLGALPNPTLSLRPARIFI